MQNVWSYAGHSNRGRVNQFLLQPFVNYNFKGGFYLTSSPILTADWTADSDIRETFLAKHGKPLHVTGEAAELIASRGYSEEFGVRQLKRTVQTLVEVPLSRLILSGDIKTWTGVVVGLRDGAVVLLPAA